MFRVGQERFKQVLMRVMQGSRPLLKLALAQATTIEQELARGIIK